MNGSLLQDAFAHHVWATLRIIDACLPLTSEQLATNVPGTYGTIIDTVRHTVGADVSYLWVLSGGKVAEIQEDGMDLPALRAAMEADGPAWSSFLEGDIDPSVDVVRHRDDGTDSHAPASVRIAQVIQHGTDHRSQICTALTTLGIAPPDIDVWDYGRQDDRVFVTGEEPTQLT
jgi:uncharacterized damage-inducible protein DinB